MTRTAALPLALLGAACASAPGPEAALAPEPAVSSPVALADPQAVAEAERAFARAAREDGTWTAFRRFATGDAVWPNPGLVSVQGDLADQTDPAEAIVWGPDNVWSSCDGSFAVSTGSAIHPDGRKTRFVTVWQRQEDGAYKWVIDQGFDLEEDYVAPEGLTAETATCAGPLTPRAVRRGEAWGSAASDDGTLAWHTAFAPDCARELSVTVRGAAGMGEVARWSAHAPAVPEGREPVVCG